MNQDQEDKKLIKFKKNFDKIKTPDQEAKENQLKDKFGSDTQLLNKIQIWQNKGYPNSMIVMKAMQYMRRRGLD